MSLLNSKFNVRRGFPFGASIDETFTPKAGINPVLKQGHFCAAGSDGTLDRVAAVDFSGAASVAALATAQATAPQLWMIFTGNEPYQYDSLKQTWVGDDLAWGPDKVVALRGNFQVTTEQYVTRAYSPGDKLCVIAGQLDLTSGSVNAGHKSVGTVISYDATAGTLTADVNI